MTPSHYSQLWSYNIKTGFKNSLSKSSVLCLAVEKRSRFTAFVELKEVIIDFTKGKWFTELEDGLIPLMMSLMAVSLKNQSTIGDGDPMMDAYTIQIGLKAIANEIAVY